jgi:hypothetical protein
MLREHSLLIVFLALLSAATVLVRAGKRAAIAESDAPLTLQAPLAQTASLRVEELATLPAPPASGPTRLVGPVRVEADETGGVFVIDDGQEETIAEFNSDGTLVQTLAGPAVPDIKSVADMVVLPNSVIIADILGKSLHYFSRKHRSWQTFADPNEPLRVETIGQKDDGLFVMRIGRRFPFDLTSLDGRVAQSFGDLLLDQSNQSLILDGYLARAGARIVFSGKYLGLLAAYNEGGDLQWLAETIVKPEPSVVVRQGDQARVSHGPIVASQGLTAHGGVIAVLARRIDRIAIRYFIDLYRSEDGRYVKTLRLPDQGKWTSVSSSGRHVFAASTQGVFRWSVDVLDASAPTDLLSAGQSIVNLKGKKGD